MHIFYGFITLENTGLILFRYYSDTIPIPILFRYYSDTAIGIFLLDIIPILFRYYSDTIPILFRYCKLLNRLLPTQICCFRYYSDTIPIVVNFAPPVVLGCSIVLVIVLMIIATIILHFDESAIYYCIFSTFVAPFRQPAKYLLVNLPPIVETET
jgi:hypothetical protein